MAIGEHEHELEHGDQTAERLRRATEALELVARDRTLLGALSEDERTRLLSAAGDVFNPDVVARRRADKENRRRRKAAKLAQEKDECC